MHPRIRAERVRLGWSQENLARILFSNQSSISEWERGERRVPDEMAREMARLFGCSVEYLLGLSNERE